MSLSIQRVVSFRMYGYSLRWGESFLVIARSLPTTWPSRLASDGATAVLGSGDGRLRCSGGRPGLRGDRLVVALEGGGGKRSARARVAQGATQARLLDRRLPAL